MQSKATALARAINRDSPINILTAPTHQRYQSNLEDLPYYFYMVQHESFIDWGDFQLPSNHELLEGSPEGILVDLILSQNKFGQAQILLPLAKEINVPSISLEHTWPHPDWTDKYLQELKKLSGDLNVFISERSAEAWGYSLDDPSVRVIHHGVDTELFSPDPSVKKQKITMSCVNDLQNRDWCCGYKEWSYISSKVSHKLVGDNPGLSKPIKNPKKLVNEYRLSSVFVNTSKYSPIPTAVLEAMACGLPVVTLDNCMLPDVIQDGYNGFISNNLDYLVSKAQQLINEKKLREEMGNNARNTILEKFSLRDHLNKWKSLISEIVYK